MFLPVLLVRQEFKYGPWFSSCAGIIRDLGFRLALHTSIQLLSSPLGMEEMKGLMERGIYFINKGREGFFLKYHEIRKLIEEIVIMTSCHFYSTFPPGLIGCSDVQISANL